MYLQCGNQKLDLTRPVVMGVVNVTPDSFSDGGKFLDRSQAVDHAQQLIEEGRPPSYWAPFVVVGEGGVGGTAPNALATSSIIPQPPTKATPSAVRPRPGKRVTTPDWRGEYGYSS